MVYSADDNKADNKTQICYDGFVFVARTPIYHLVGVRGALF